MSTEMHTIALQMYCALRALPCGCCRRWDKEAEDGYIVTKVCSRCRAMRAYEVALKVEELPA